MQRPYGVNRGVTLPHERTTKAAAAATTANFWFSHRQHYDGTDSDGPSHGNDRPTLTRGGSPAHPTPSSSRHGTAIVRSAVECERRRTPIVVGDQRSIGSPTVRHSVRTDGTPDGVRPIQPAADAGPTGTVRSRHSTTIAPVHPTGVPTDDGAVRGLPEDGGGGGGTEIPAATSDTPDDEHGAATSDRADDDDTTVPLGGDHSGGTGQ